MEHARDELILRYIDGELSPSEAAGLERHLEECAECRRVLERYMCLDAIARSLMGEEWDIEEFTVQVAAKVREAERAGGEHAQGRRELASEAQKGKAGPKRRKPYAAHWARFAVAASFLITLGAGAGWYGLRARYQMMLVQESRVLVDLHYAIKGGVAGAVADLGVRLP